MSKVMAAIVMLVVVGGGLGGILYALRHIICGALGLYRIIPVNEAHIRIMGKKKAIFSARTGTSAYWFIPFVTRVHKLPLCNLSIPVNDVKLNDKDMAKFVCDIACFIRISNLELASESLILTTGARDEMGFDFNRLSEDLKAIMESIGRTVTTKQTILDIYMDRSLLDDSITKEVAVIFPKWGIELIDLELKDIKDAPNSSIIDDIERKVAARYNREAEIEVANNMKQAEVVKAEAEEVFRTRQILKDKKVGIALQEAEVEIQGKRAAANLAEIDAKSKMEVGQAEINKKIVMQQAEAERQKQELEAEGFAKAVQVKGQAEADIIKAKLVAEAEGQDKLADALKKFDDKALAVKKLEIGLSEIQARMDAFAKIGEKADIKWILSGENAKGFMDVLTANGGANLDQFLGMLGQDGAGIDKIKQVVDKLKSAF